MNQIQIIEYKGQRVLMTAQLAESYETEMQIITNNFNRNKERYTEGKHFKALSGEEKREFLCKNQIDFSNKDHSTLYLWTKKGALMHAKSLNTDKAWEAYEMLIDEYYDVKEQRTISVAKYYELQIKMKNACYREASIYLKVAGLESTEPICKQRLRAKAIEVLAGEQILPMPELLAN